MSVTFTVGGDSVVLRNPTFPMTKSVNEHTRNYTDGQGGVHTFISTNTTKRLNMEFIHLTDDNKDDFKDFLDDHIDDEITLNDWDGTSWTGKIVINPFEFSDNARGICTDQYHSLIVLFQGSKV